MFLTTFSIITVTVFLIHIYNINIFSFYEYLEKIALLTTKFLLNVNKNFFTLFQNENIFNYKIYNLLSSVSVLFNNIIYYIKLSLNQFVYFYNNEVDSDSFVYV
jgi:hypothetical protein